MYSAMAKGAVSHGLNVAVVEYTLAPEARMDRIVGDVRHAISWLHEHLGDDNTSRHGQGRDRNPQHLRP